jgi:hypothetical protein
MPHSSDEPTSDRSGVEAPGIPPAEGPASEPNSPSGPSPVPDHVSAEGDPQSSTADGDAVSGLPRRRRRRRRRPPRQTDPTQVAAAPQEQAEPLATAGEVSDSGDLPAVSPDSAGPRRRRRRRRGPPREPGAAEAVAGAAAEAADPASGSSLDIASASDGEPRPDQLHGQPRHRRRRRPPPPPPESSAAEIDRVADGVAARSSRAGAPQYRSGPYRGPQNRGARNPRNGDERSPERGPARDDRRSADRRAGGKRPPARGDRRQGRDRDAPSKRPQPRLYALEAIVDRGFEDVVDAAEDNLTRRVHWTIVKRTVADQESGKPISAVYVLKREGLDTEFPGLGAARAAANKTIVHPEKLTLSKAEHAAAKK